MANFNNAMEIFQLLAQPNCRKCNLASCLAFAGAVLQRRKQLAECPAILEDIIRQYDSRKIIEGRPVTRIL